MPTPTQIRSQITQQIVTSLQGNTIPWRMPWTTSKNSGRPTSVSTGKPYSGINPLVLQLHAARHGFQSKWWATFNEWRRLGCTVKARPSGVESGKWGCQITYYKAVSKTAIDQQKEEEKFFLLRTFTVFCADQVNGEAAKRYQVSQAGPAVEVSPDFEAAEQLIAATQADIRYGGDRAFYACPAPLGSWPKHTGGDYIQVPHRWQFAHLNELYSVVLHELAHWSEPRRSWTGTYAMGELIAEMSAAFLSTELGVPQSEDLSNHAHYLATWLEAMKGDPSYIFVAASEASKVADFLLNHVKRQATAEKVPA